MRRTAFDFVLIAIVSCLLISIACRSEAPTSAGQKEVSAMSYTVPQLTRTVYAGTVTSIRHKVIVPELTLADMPSIIGYVRPSNMPPFWWIALPVYSDYAVRFLCLEEQRLTIINCNEYEFKIVVIK